MGKDKIIRLYDLEKGTRIKAEVTNDEGKKIGDFIIFSHIDGMYSYCTVESKEEERVHVPAVQEVKKVGDYYELL